MKLSGLYGMHHQTVRNHLLRRGITLRQTHIPKRYRDQSRKFDAVLHRQLGRLVVRFRVKNQGPEVAVLRLEPQGSEYQLLPGDYYEFEWEDAPGPLIGTIEYEPDAITISEGNGPARMWDSRGEEISTLG